MTDEVRLGIESRFVVTVERIVSVFERIRLCLAFLNGFAVV